MVGKKGPRKLLVASVGVATINYALIGCDTFAPADEEGVPPDTFVTGGKSFGTAAGTAPIFPTSGNLPCPFPVGGIGGGGFAGQNFGGAAGGGMGGLGGGGMGGINAGGGGDAATGGDASGGDGAGGADGAAGDAAGGADGAGGVDGAGGGAGAP